MILSTPEVNSILEAKQGHPHVLLGMHLYKKGLVIRVWVQDSVDCAVIECTSAQEPQEKRYELKKVHELGLYEGFIEDRKAIFKYRLRVKKTNGEIRQFYDPYSFLPTLEETDLYLFNEGTHYKAFEKIGSHIKTHQGVLGVSFIVWAPSAQRVSIVGDFNHWDGRYHPMRNMGSSGLWELFIPGLGEGVYYKYEILTNRFELILKSDPWAHFYESAPHNASIVYDMGGYQWQDKEWVKKREKTDWKKEPISIYEMHVGSWKRVVEEGNRFLTYRELAVELIQYLKEKDYTHVEFMPLAEHPFAGSWGYQVTGFFAPTHRFGTPQDFMYLVDQLHQQGLGVIVDWVPAHFPKDAFALARFDGTCLYEHEDPRQGEHKDWGTLIFNYGRHEVRTFLINSALAWLERFHIDGFRVDAVASMLYLNYSKEDGEWLPNEYGGHENIQAIEFLRQANDTIHRFYPGVITIAEESTAFGRVSWPTKDYGLGFDFKWNMGWMHDILEYFKQDPLYRKGHHNKLTFGMLYQYSENYVLVFSHDEVVHGKGSMLMKMGSWFIRDKAHTLRVLYTFMWAWPGKKTLFMGSDFGQTHEWQYDASLDWHLLKYGEHAGLQLLIRDLNRWYKTFPTLAKHDFNPQGFEWINTHDENNSILSFIRTGDKPTDTFLFIGNFTPVARENYRVGVPHEGQWREMINTDALEYAGTGAGNQGLVETELVEWNARPYSLNLLLPSLSALILKFDSAIYKPSQKAEKVSFNNKF